MAPHVPHMAWPTRLVVQSCPRDRVEDDRRAVAASTRHWLRWRLRVCGLGSLVLSACQPTPTVESSAELARIQRDLPYASSHPLQRLDLYWPPTGTGPFPVVVWVHGGGWSSGSRLLEATSPQRRLTARGFAVASVGYRLSGVALYPAAARDIKSSVRFLRANAAQLRIDPARIALWGESAGAHLALLAGLTGDTTAFDDQTAGYVAQSARVQAIVSWFAPTSILTLDDDGAAQGCPVFNGTGHDAASAPLARFLGVRPSTQPALAREASPITWVSADDPPTLIQHGGRDCTVPTRQGRRLFDALSGAQRDTSRVALTLLVAGGHGGPSFDADDNVTTIANFLQRHLR